LVDRVAGEIEGLRLIVGFTLQIVQGRVRAAALPNSSTRTWYRESLPLWASIRRVGFDPWLARWSRVDYIFTTSTTLNFQKRASATSESDLRYFLGSLVVHRLPRLFDQVPFRFGLIEATDSIRNPVRSR
jgi:hypothetical protein